MKLEEKEESIYNQIKEILSDKDKGLKIQIQILIESLKLIIEKLEEKIKELN